MAQAIRIILTLLIGLLVLVFPVLGIAEPIKFLRF